MKRRRFTLLNITYLSSAAFAIRGKFIFIDDEVFGSSVHNSIVQLVNAEHLSQNNPVG